MKLIAKIVDHFLKYRKSQCNLFIIILKYIYYKVFYKKNIIAHQRVTIKGITNIMAKESLHIGTSYVGFSMKNDKTFLNIQGKMYVEGPCSIGRGCRFDISKDAILRIGKRGFVNANTMFIISHGLHIGNNCSIAWGCQFIDNDFHYINYENRQERSNKIIIGNNVWIGCNTCILKGTIIPDNCVIGANSVVSGIFKEESTLIAGNPARVIKKQILWQA